MAAKKKDKDKGKSKASPATKKKTLGKLLGASKKTAGGKKAGKKSQSLAKKDRGLKKSRALKKSRIIGAKKSAADKKMKLKKSQFVKTATSEEAEESGEAQPTEEAGNGAGETDLEAKDEVQEEQQASEDVEDNGTATVYAPVEFTRQPQDVRCPDCEEVVTTEIKKAIGMANIFVGIFCGIFCCWPLFAPFLRDIRHTCPNCHRELGRWRRCQTFNK